MNTLISPGSVRVFPLSKLLLLPQTYQHLNVFESRYLKLVKDSLESDQKICMAVIEAGHEVEYLGNPPLYKDACIGHIEKCVTNQDGTYYVTLKGIQEVCLQEEISGGSFYRSFTCQPKKFRLPHREPTSNALRAQLLSFLDFLYERAGENEARRWVNSIRDYELMRLVHQLCVAMPLRLDLQMQLAASEDLIGRGYLLLDLVSEIFPDFGNLELKNLIH
ncbi:MAG: LON peptidase substrate-binding domain-containing protein [Candidatus Cloacimonetes bacterium]|nr:LON peptidase substrate-binding domain-containing protein [Candidatus Cloacimonadota bacterium]